MKDIRRAYLAAHAAARTTLKATARRARKAKAENPARFAARAAGQAVAIAHVPQHAFGGTYYTLKSITAADPDNAETNTAKECDWQSKRLPKHLRKEIMSRIIIQKKGGKILIKIKKDEGFY